MGESVIVSGVSMLYGQGRGVACVYMCVQCVSTCNGILENVISHTRARVHTHIHAQSYNDVFSQKSLE